MGAALFIVPEREVEGLDTSVDGKALGHAKHFYQLARQAGVRPLQDFFSVSPGDVMAFMEDEGAEPAGDFPPEQWFSADEGLATVRGMLAYLVANPNAIREADRVAEDLRQFEVVLSGLQAADVRWHASIHY